MLEAWGDDIDKFLLVRDRDRPFSRLRGRLVVDLNLPRMILLRSQLQVPPEPWFVPHSVQPDVQASDSLQVCLAGRIKELRRFLTELEVGLCPW